MSTWEIREKETGRVIFETSNEHLIGKMLPQYEAIPRQDVLTDTQCQRVISDLEEREWTGLTNDDIRMIAGLINAAGDCTQ